VGAALRQTIHESGATPVISPKKECQGVVSVQQALYRKRNLIERLINKLKHCRRIATRFEKNSINFLAMLHLAASQVWLRLIDDTT
jgi:transposase